MYPDCNGNGVRSPTIQVQTYATKSFNHDDDGDRGQSRQCKSQIYQLDNTCEGDEAKAE